MKKSILVICFALVISQVMGQKVKFDSLINMALANRFKAKVIEFPNRDSLFKLLPLAKSSRQRVELIYTIINNGQETSNNGLNYYYKILAWSKTAHDHVSEAIILAALGYNTYQNGENGNGLKMLFDALKFAQDTGDAYTIGAVYRDLGLYYLGNDIPLYKLYTQKALHFGELARDSSSICMENASLGSICYQQHKPDSGEIYFYKSLEMAVRINDLQEIARTIAFISSQEKVDSVSLRYQMARVAIATAAKSQLNMSHAFDGLAAYYLKHHNIDSGLYYANKAYFHATSTSLAARVRSSKLLYQLYNGGNRDSSLKYTEIYTVLRDSATNIQKIQAAQNLELAEQQHQQDITKQHQDDQNRLKFYVLFIITGFLLLLALVFWRNYRRGNKINGQLQNQKLQTEQTLNELKVTQAQLIQSEKMASLGQITAGIAHEIRNPINFVNNFSDVSIDMLEQLKTDMQQGNSQDAITLTNDLTQIFEKIRRHGQRANGIVKSMMRSRADSSQKEPTDINQLTEQYFNLAYQDLRAKDRSFNIEPIKHFGEGLPVINVIQQDMGRVLLNLFNNAFYAVQQKQKNNDNTYRPTVEIRTSVSPLAGLVIAVKDNGTGIPEVVIGKIMQPFFTTKPAGEGTGLGLSLSYDIVVKGHGGKIEVTSTEGEGTEFVILLPVSA